jgi:uncharacterized membrane protein
MVTANPLPREADLSRSKASLLLALIVTGGIVLRCGELSRRSIWFDEAFSWRLTQFSVTELVERTASDVHPPFYYILLKAWTAVFGTSVIALRSLSVVFGALTIVGTYLFTAEAFRNRVELGAGEHKKAKSLGLFAACLVAVSVFQSRYGSETRMYALGTTLTVFSSWSLLLALRSHSRNLSRWLLFALLSLLFLYTHNYAMFSLFAQAVFVLGWLFVQADWNFLAIFRSTTFRYGLLTVGFVILSYLPWLPVFLGT